MNIQEKALGILRRHFLCDHCLGRQFGLLGREMENCERGKAIRTAIALGAKDSLDLQDREGVRYDRVVTEDVVSSAVADSMGNEAQPNLGNIARKACYLCQDKFRIVKELAEQSLEKMKDYEYSSFMVGIRLPVAVEEREDELRAEFDISHGENMRNEFARTIGKKIVKHSGKLVEHKKPHLVILINPFAREVTIQANPLYISGRYRKEVRGLPQSCWYCSRCRGEGCEKCNWTGRMYSESIEEIIGKPLLDVTGGTKAVFHASGREDIDVRMLGSGRPFAVEISQPKKRFLHPETMKEAINTHAQEKVTVLDLGLANKDVVRKLKKAESARKEYCMIMEFEDEVRVEELRSLEEKLTNIIVKQRTPMRVLHRRADLIREKYIYDVKVKRLSPKTAKMKICCEGGLYVKELVTGDGGRTKPNVSEILRKKASSRELDVLNVILEHEG